MCKGPVVEKNMATEEGLGSREQRVRERDEGANLKSPCRPFVRNLFFILRAVRR